ncbi:MAG: hypothetical protein K0B16_02630 [Burkholderiaceae bacterium]|nr:hypothetical protein [Burkholderiaceae bacterium]
MTENPHDRAPVVGTGVNAPPDLDLGRIRRLIDELDAEVANAPGDVSGVQDLKDEITTLRAVLDAPKQKSGWIAEGLHTIGVQLEQSAKSLRGEVLRESVFAAEIARILGL